MMTAMEMALTATTAVLAVTVSLLRARSRDQRVILEVTRGEVGRLNQEMERQTEEIRQRRAALEEEDQRRANLLKTEEQRVLMLETKLEHSRRRVRFLEGVERDLREKIKTALGNLEASREENQAILRRVMSLEETQETQEGTIQQRDREIKGLQERLPGGRQSMATHLGARITTGTVEPDGSTQLELLQSYVGNLRFYLMWLWFFLSPTMHTKIRRKHPIAYSYLSDLVEQLPTYCMSAEPSDHTPRQD